MQKPFNTEATEQPQLNCTHCFRIVSRHSSVLPTLEGRVEVKPTEFSYEVIQELYIRSEYLYEVLLIHFRQVYCCLELTVTHYTFNHNGYLYSPFHLVLVIDFL